MTGRAKQADRHLAAVPNWEGEGKVIVDFKCRRDGVDYQAEDPHPVNAVWRLACTAERSIGMALLF